ncbi:unnamed protein product, partial [marine sediment metagenome]
MARQLAQQSDLGGHASLSNFLFKKVAGRRSVRERPCLNREAIYGVIHDRTVWFIIFIIILVNYFLTIPLSSIKCPNFSFLVLR